MQILILIIITIYVYHSTVLVNADGFDGTLGHITSRSRGNDDVQTNAVKQLITRIIPKESGKFIIVVNSSFTSDGKDVFMVQSLDDGNIYISGTNGVAAASGFNYYLKYYCNCQISWETAQLNIPTKLPPVNITQTFSDRFRYYQNVCTTSYSFVWWNWEQWEKHIDWIVLNSFNFVLAFNGQEAIWERVYKKFNLTQEEIDDHFSGPTFLSWLRMGNIRGWGGPLSQNWHTRSVILQKQILKKLRSFGVITILPAFAGHVPRAFKKLYPEANMVQMGSWNGFNDTYCCPYFLDPNEELFKTVGKMFMNEQISEFGTDHVYNCDSFNENTPVSTNLTYLANIGKSIYESMTIFDPKAIWVMQNWLFVHDFFFWTRSRAEALLTSVPKGKMIVLDLQSEQFPQYTRFDQYFGQPYIWCMLHNFGGTLGMHGSSDIINERPSEARSAKNSTMIGTGLTPEGINQNYVIYDLMTESAWREEPTNLTQWFQNYATRRYGMEDSNAVKAWLLLQNSLYNFKGLERIRGQYVITRTPSLNIQTWIWYDPKNIQEAMQLLLKSASNLQNNEGFMYDLVDISRQLLQVSTDHIYGQIVDAFRNKSSKEFDDARQRFMLIFRQLNEILKTNEAFSLEKWIKSARSCGQSEEEKDAYEYNARNQITLWGPKGEIMNYAIKQWSGVASDLLVPRWELFLNYLKETLTNGTKYNGTYIKEQMFKKVEEPFTLKKMKLSSNQTVSDKPIKIAVKIQELACFKNLTINTTRRNSRYKVKAFHLDLEEFHIPTVLRVK